MISKFCTRGCAKSRLSLYCINFVVGLDDVYTTGATMEAAAHELKLGGAEKVVGMTIASGAI